MDKSPITVYIVDDSLVSRELLSHILAADPDIRVVGVAKDGPEALSWLQANSVDVITMDIVMPGIDGFEVTRRIMETRPTPIVIISGGYAIGNATREFASMEAGALAILEKPSGFGDIAYYQKSKEIVNTVKMVSEVKLIRRYSRNAEVENSHTVLPLKLSEGVFGGIAAVGIGASLGGPVALVRLISSLRPDFPVPIFIVQHIAAGFTEGLVKWIQGFTKIRICLGKEGEIALPCHCYVAPSGCQMTVEKGGRIALDYASKEPLKPSVASLFRSMTKTYGRQAVGVILTGMGTDGAQELLGLKNSGAYTIAQDEKSCVMFGMPREAIALGAACQVLSLEQIAGALNGLVTANPKASAVSSARI